MELVFLVSLSWAQSCQESPGFRPLEAFVQNCEQNWEEASCTSFPPSESYSQVLARVEKSCSTEELSALRDRLVFRQISFLISRGRPEDINLAEKIYGTKLSDEVLKQRVEALLQRDEREHCAAKDYRDRLPPVRDQGSMGWCFGFAAADMLSFKTGQNISAADLSLSFFTSPAVRAAWGESLRSTSVSTPLETPVSRLGGGDIRAVLEGARRGVCLERDFPSQDFSLVGRRVELGRALTTIETYAMRQSGESLPRKCQRRCKEDGKEPMMEELAASPALMAPNVDADALAETVRSASSQRVVLDINRLACRQRSHFHFGPVRHRTGGGASGSARAIQEELMSGGIVAISYNADVLIDPTATNKTYDSSNAHASTVVGQRWNEAENRCEFLLRNSYGSSCGYYHSSYQCEAGSVWIPARTLGAAINGMDTID